MKLDIRSDLKKIIKESKNQSVRVLASKLINTIADSEDENAASFVVERLKEHKSDSAVISMFKTRNIKSILNKNLGVAQAITECKQSSACKNDSELGDILAVFEEKIQDGAGEYQLISSFIPAIKRYSFDYNIKRSVSVLEGKIEKMRSFSLIAEAIDALESETDSEFNGDLINKLSAAYSLPESEVRHYVNTTVGDYADVSAPISQLVRKLYLLKRNDSDTLATNRAKTNFIVTKDGRISVNDKISPLFVSESKKYHSFTIGGKIFHKIGNRIVESKLPYTDQKVNNKFMKLVESFNQFKQIGNDLNISDGYNTVTITENQENGFDVIVNGNKFNFENTQQLTEDLQDAEVAPEIIEPIVDVVENADNIVRMDNIVTAETEDGTIIEILKTDKGISINICNEKEGINEMVETDASIDTITSFKNDYGIDISPVVEASTDIEQSTDEEIKQSQDEYKELETELGEINESLGQIEVLGEDYEDDPTVSKLKQELSSRKSSVLEKMEELNKKINGDETETVSVSIDRIISIIGELVKDEAETGEVVDITDSISIVPNIIYDENGVTDIVLTVDGADLSNIEIDGVIVDGNNLSINSEPFTVDDVVPVSIKDKITDILSIIAPSNKQGEVIE